MNLPIAPDAPPMRAPANAEARAIPTQGNDVPVSRDAVDAAQTQIDEDARERALEQIRLEEEKQSAERQRQAELTAQARREAAQQEQRRQDAARAEQAARNEAARMEAERQELARQEGLRREAARQEQAKQDEKARLDAARQEQERAEATRLEAARREATRQEQARQAQLEAARQVQNQRDAARQDALKQEAARQDAIRQEAARQDAIKQEAARQERAKQDQAQRERAEQDEKRAERLRAIGKQLAEEAAQRDAAINPASKLQPTVSSLRRGLLLGRADTNTDLVLYAEAMSRKIELNMTFDIVREAVKQPHARPTVTVAIRADGSVEKVTFVVSSGVPAIDEAIRKVVASQAPYGAFPPSLARQYDVIEIRRTWVFDMAIRLQ
ncbi:MAG: TonB C-terminal domain-containing protein [Telluria sp.]